MNQKVCDMLPFIMCLGMKWMRAWSYLKNEKSLPMAQQLTLNKSLWLSISTAIFIINLKKGYLNILAILNCILIKKFYVPEIFVYSVEVFKSYNTAVLVDVYRILCIAFRTSKIKI